MRNDSGGVLTSLLATVLLGWLAVYAVLAMTFVVIVVVVVALFLVGLLAMFGVAGGRWLWQRAADPQGGASDG